MIAFRRTLVNRKRGRRSAHAAGRTSPSHAAGAERAGISHGGGAQPAADGEPPHHPAGSGGPGPAAAHRPLPRGRHAGAGREDHDPHRLPPQRPRPGEVPDLPGGGEAHPRQHRHLSGRLHHRRLHHGVPPSSAAGDGGDQRSHDRRAPPEQGYSDLLPGGRDRGQFPGLRRPHRPGRSPELQRGPDVLLLLRDQ